jgi:hypothetical protein
MKTRSNRRHNSKNQHHFKQNLFLLTPIHHAAMIKRKGAMVFGWQNAPNGRRSFAVHSHVPSPFPLGRPASRTLGVIELVGQSHPPVRRTLEKPRGPHAIIFACGAIFSGPPAGRPRKMDRPSGSVARTGPERPAARSRSPPRASRGWTGVIGTCVLPAQFPIPYFRASSSRTDASSAPQASAAAAVPARQS